jgi:DNA-binding transcriptional ArsR family regulator
LGPVFGPDAPRFVPDCLVPASAASVSRFEDELARVAAVTGDELVAEIAADGMLGSPWSLVARSPRRWLGAYVDALQRGWTAVAPLWARAAPLVEREFERVGVAAVRRTLDQLIDRLHPEDGVDDARWVLDCAGPVPVADELVLVPIVCGPRASISFVDGEGRACRFAYPVPGAFRLVGQAARPAAAEDGLVALLGASRADLLRRLDRPTTPGRLAAQLQFAPSAISHHLATLERAGLVARERSGRHVVVRRSARGTAVLHLYDG